jgi:uncharacterized protein (TIGR02599 family)
MKIRAMTSGRCEGFSLVELMVSVSLIVVVALLLVSMTNSTASTWRYTTDRTEQFRSAEAAFEAVARRLSQATLNTYWDYDDPLKPTIYQRQSELRFIMGQMTTGPRPLLAKTARRQPTHGVFFQAPLGFVNDAPNFSGLENLLNTWGYYVEFSKDVRPPFIDTMSNPPPARYRYRLMELMQPSNSLSVFKYTSGMHASNKPNTVVYKGKEWFADLLPKTADPGSATAVPEASHVLAENVIALVLLPKLSKKEEEKGKRLTKDYGYDSTNPTNVTDPEINPKNQLPPIVQMTVVAIDEGSASRIANGSTPPPFDKLLDTLFLDAGAFEADLQLLQATLASASPPIRFRVFTTNIGIRGAKWSKD